MLRDWDENKNWKMEIQSTNQLPMNTWPQSITKSIICWRGMLVCDCEGCSIWNASLGFMNFILILYLKINTNRHFHSILTSMYCLMPRYKMNLYPYNIQSSNLLIDLASCLFFESTLCPYSHNFVHIAFSRIFWQF